MKPNRRRFLSLLGVGAAASPLTAKAALDETIGKQVGISNALSGTTGGFVGGAVPESTGSNLSYQQKYDSVATYIKAFGIPDVVKETYRMQSKYVHALDPDIACKKSWSMSVKIMTQQERNYQRVVDGIDRSASYYRRKGVIDKILGFEWPW